MKKVCAQNGFRRMCNKHLALRIITATKNLMNLLEILKKLCEKNFIFHMQKGRILVYAKV